MSDNFRQAVRDAWGGACLICGRSPEGWLNTTEGERRQDKLSLHGIEEKAHDFSRGMNPTTHDTNHPR